jgi:hypothetical protein
LKEKDQVINEREKTIGDKDNRIKELEREI